MREAWAGAGRELELQRVFATDVTHWDEERIPTVNRTVSMRVRVNCE